MTINNEKQQKDNNKIENFTKNNWQLQLSPISVTLIPVFEPLSTQASNIISSTVTNYVDIIKSQLELQEANSKLKATELMKRDFMQNVIHSFKMPCHGIFSLVTALYEIEDNLEKKDYLATIVNCAEELLSHYNNIVNFSQSNAGLPSLALKKFDLKKLVNKIISQTKPIAWGKGLNLSANFQYDIADVIVSDSYRLQAILEQLIDNAIKFTKQGNIVVTVNIFASSLSALEQDNKERVLQFIVHDTGIGLAKDQQQYLCEEFNKFDSSMQCKNLGSGLSFVKRLIDEMHGEIEVTSEAGKSTTIVCNIPVKLPVLADVIYNDDK